MAAGKSCIVEANFRPEWGPQDTQRLLDACHYHAAQVYCQTEEETLIARFCARWESGERHPGHVADATYDHIRESVRNQVNGPSALSAPLLTIDTTDWDTVDVASILAWIAA